MRNISDSVVDPNVRAALLDAAALVGDEPVAVIGALALGAYAQPRTTQDIDLISSDSDVPAVIEALKLSFTPYAAHALEHKISGVSVEIITSSTVNNVSAELADAAIEHAEPHQAGSASIKVVTIPYFIALKLCRALTKNVRAYIDKGDIVGILKTHGYQDLSAIPISPEARVLYEQLWMETQQLTD
ncbi:hypothetical protein BH09SUM1_BH09SUM1_29020 [soil metagenome]